MKTFVHHANNVHSNNNPANVYLVFYEGSINNAHSPIHREYNTIVKPIQERLSERNNLVIYLGNIRQLTYEFKNLTSTLLTDTFDSLKHEATTVIEKLSDLESDISIQIRGNNDFDAMVNEIAGDMERGSDDTIAVLANIILDSCAETLRKSGRAPNANTFEDFFRNGIPQTLPFAMSIKDIRECMNTAPADSNNLV